MSKAWHDQGGMRHMSKGIPDAHVNDPHASHGMSSFGSTGDAWSGMQSKIDGLKTFFGEPSAARVARLKEEVAKGVYEQEYQSYPEAFSALWGNENGGMAHNGHITRTLIEKIKASENWQLSHMAPWQYSHALSFAWDEIRFNKHMLDAEPEESVPRLLTSTRSSGSASMTRYGIALLLEANFASTPAGQRTYLLNLEQMRIATVETASFGAMIAVLQHEPYENQYDAMRRGDSSFASTMEGITARFDAETTMFGIVHKSADGYATVKDKLRTQLSSRLNGTDGNFTIVPRGMGTAVQRTHDNKFYLDGRAASRTITHDLRAAGLGAHDSVIVESRPFSNGEGEEGFDPLFRETTIGGFSTFDDTTLGNVPVGEYRTDMLDYDGYDCDGDRLHRFRFRSFYDKTGVWNFRLPNAPLTDRIGLGVAYDLQCYTWGQVIEKCASDPQYIWRSLAGLPREKQVEVLSSLRQLPARDPRVRFDARNESTPFSRRLFDEMRDVVGMQWDRTWSDPQRRALKRGYEPGDSIADMDQARHEFAEYAAKQPSDKRARLADGSALDLFAAGDQEDEKKSTEDDMEVDFHAGSVTKHTTESVTRSIAHLASRGMMPPDASRRSDRHVAGDIIAELEALGAKDAGIKLAVDRIKGSMERLTGITDAMYLRTAREAQRIVHGELLRITGQRSVGAIAAALVAAPLDSAKRKEFASRAVAFFQVHVASIETRGALFSIGVERTQLERDKIAKDGADLGDVTIEQATPGWWNPPGVGDREDGQVRLVLIQNDSSYQHTAPLPHDTYAATLAAEHDVIFAVDPAAVLQPAAAAAQGRNTAVPVIDIAPGIKQSRRDALVWSIMLSYVASGRVSDAAFGTASQVNAADSDLVKRLRRVAALRPSLSATLACQSHMTISIAAAVKTLRAIAASGAMFVAPPAGPPAARNPDASDLLDAHGDSIKAALRTGYVHVVAPQQQQQQSGAAQPASKPEQLVVPMGGLDQPFSLEYMREQVGRASIVDGSFYERCVFLDVPLALTVRNDRPNKRHRMAAVVRMVAGPNGAARTMFKNPNFMMVSVCALLSVVVVAFWTWTMSSRTCRARRCDVDLLPRPRTPRRRRSSATCTCTSRRSCSSRPRSRSRSTSTAPGTSAAGARRCGIRSTSTRWTTTRRTSSAPTSTARSCRCARCTVRAAPSRGARSRARCRPSSRRSRTSTIAWRTRAAAPSPSSGTGTRASGRTRRGRTASTRKTRSSRT